jgi:hypothetical protein
MHRTEIKKLRDIPNVGEAIEKELALLGISEPVELIGSDPYQMYRDLCKITSRRQDPCVIDVFISAVRYMEGAPAKKWWEYTRERKQRLAGH